MGTEEVKSNDFGKVTTFPEFRSLMSRYLHNAMMPEIMACFSKEISDDLNAVIKNADVVDSLSQGDFFKIFNTDSYDFVISRTALTRRLSSGFKATNTFNYLRRATDWGLLFPITIKGIPTSVQHGIHDMFYINVPAFVFYTRLSAGYSYDSVISFIVSNLNMLFGDTSKGEEGVSENTIFSPEFVKSFVFGSSIAPGTVAFTESQKNLLCENMQVAVETYFKNISNQEFFSTGCLAVNNSTFFKDACDIYFRKKANGTGVKSAVKSTCKSKGSKPGRTPAVSKNKTAKVSVTEIEKSDYISDFKFESVSGDDFSDTGTSTSIKASDIKELNETALQINKKVTYLYDALRSEESAESDSEVECSAFNSSGKVDLTLALPAFDKLPDSNFRRMFMKMAEQLNAIADQCLRARDFMNITADESAYFDVFSQLVRMCAASSTEKSREETEG